MGMNLIQQQQVLGTFRLALRLLHVLVEDQHNGVRHDAHRCRQTPRPTARRLVKALDWPIPASSPVAPGAHGLLEFHQAVLQPRGDFFMTFTASVEMPERSASGSGSPRIHSEICIGDKCVMAISSLVFEPRAALEIDAI